jgi:hypothetical protein
MHRSLQLQIRSKIIFICFFLFKYFQKVLCIVVYWTVIIPAGWLVDSHHANPMGDTQTVLLGRTVPPASMYAFSTVHIENILLLKCPTLKTSIIKRPITKPSTQNVPDLETSQTSKRPRPQNIPLSKCTITKHHKSLNIPRHKTSHSINVPQHLTSHSTKRPTALNVPWHKQPSV